MALLTIMLKEYLYLNNGLDPDPDPKPRVMDPDPAKSSGSMRIRILILIHNTDINYCIRQAIGMGVAKFKLPNAKEKQIGLYIVVYYYHDSTNFR
jgi:hypothetical protein